MSSLITIDYQITASILRNLTPKGGEFCTMNFYWTGLPSILVAVITYSGRSAPRNSFAKGGAMRISMSSADQATIKALPAKTPIVATTSTGLVAVGVKASDAALNHPFLRDCPPGGRPLPISIGEADISEDLKVILEAVIGLAGAKVPSDPGAAGYKLIGGAGNLATSHSKLDILSVGAAAEEFLSSVDVIPGPIEKVVSVIKIGGAVFSIYRKTSSANTGLS